MDDARWVHGIGTICFVHKRSLHHWFSDRNTCLKHNFPLKPNGSATFSITKQKVPCMTVFAVVNMFANEFLLRNEGSNALFCSKPNGACKTNIISKHTKQSNIWYVAHFPSKNEGRGGRHHLRRARADRDRDRARRINDSSPARS